MDEISHKMRPVSRDFEFSLLGPLEVTSGGAAVELGPYKQRALIAVLALNANKLVSTDRIIDALWGDDAGDKERAVWVYVSRLRSALEPDRSGHGESSVLIRRDPGYELRIDPDTVDLHRFERLVLAADDLRRSDPAQALDTYAEALSLWRGDALDEFVYETFAVNEIARLNELRLHAAESRVGVALDMGQSSELISELELVCRQNPYRERPVGQLMVALYRSGRHAEALRVFERHRRTVTVELGVEPSPELVRLQEQVLLHDSALTSEQTSTNRATTTRNPYRGLLPFTEGDAGDFYGRNGLIAEILKRVERGDGLVSVVGPSGSGKSSLIRAGVLPRIRKGVIEGSDGWLIASMTPGQFPFAELEAALLRSALDPPAGLSEQLAPRQRDSILAAALRVLNAEDGHLVLFIDQFEELFTTVEDEEARRQFLDGLLAAAQDNQNRVSVILTLRADLYNKPLHYAEFGAQLGPSVVNVTPMSAEELEEAAVQPARAASLELEQSLLVKLVSDVQNQPGGLPMFQFALTELVERAGESTLLRSDYEAMGGVSGAIAHRATDVYDNLAPEEQAAARQLFLRLVAVKSADAVGRRRVPASDISSLDVDIVALQTVITRFAEARLLSLDRDMQTNAPTVEVGHEALLTEWARLEAWIAESRHDLTIHASLVGAVREWENSGRHADYLVRGTRLAEFDRLRSAGLIDLNTGELEYLNESSTAVETEAAVEAERSARERELAQRAKRRLWASVGAVAILAGIAVVWLLAAASTPPTIAIVGVPQPDAEAQSGGYLALLQSGFDQAEAVHEFEPIEIPFSVTDLQDAVANIAAGSDLVVSSEFLGGPTAELIRQHPDTMFVILSRYPRARTGLPNEVGITFANEEGAFIAGVAAAMTTTTGKVGFLGAAQAADAIDPARAGFEAGVRHISNEIEILVTHKSGAVEAFEDDPIVVHAAARQLYEEGVDVILEWTAALDGPVLQAALEVSAESGLHRWVIGGGDGSDRRRFADADHVPHVLFSVIRNVDAAVFTSIDTYMTGDLRGGRIAAAIATGGIEMGTMAPDLAVHAAQLRQIRDDIVSGAIDPPIVPHVRPLPPVGFVETTAIGVFIHPDGECTIDYAGPPPRPTMFISYEVDNRSDTPYYFGERHEPAFIVPLGVSVPPGGTTVLYYEHIPVQEVFVDDPPTELLLECAPFDDANYNEGQPLQVVSLEG